MASDGEETSSAPADSSKLLRAEVRELRAKLRAANARTRLRIKEHQRPESKTNQQDSEPSEICKTSIPGSNPGGASIFPVRFRSFVRAVHKRTPLNCLELSRMQWGVGSSLAQIVDASWLRDDEIRGGQRSAGPPFVVAVPVLVLDTEVGFASLTRLLVMPFGDQLWIVIVSLMARPGCSWSGPPTRCPDDRTVVQGAYRKASSSSAVSGDA
jgi:hypothetical protein